LVEKHGGMLTEVHECFTFQIEPLRVKFYKILYNIVQNKANRKDYFEGDVISAKWLVDSVKEGKL
jgi:hypothetical protein